MRPAHTPAAPGAASGLVVDCLPTGKTVATPRARAALAGWTLAGFTEPDGQTAYTLCRWGMARTLPDLAAVALFLRQVGAPE